MILTSTKQIREYTKKGWWGIDTILDKLYARAASIPASEALVDPYTRRTWWAWNRC